LSEILSITDAPDSSLCCSAMAATACPLAGSPLPPWPLLHTRLPYPYYEQRQRQAFSLFLSPTCSGRALYARRGAISAVGRSSRAGPCDPSVRPACVNLALFNSRSYMST
jgi:hypothetical protein